MATREFYADIKIHGKATSSLTPAELDLADDSVLVTKEYVDNNAGPIPVADNAALVLEATEGRMFVGQVYDIATDVDGDSNIQIQIRYRKPNGEFWYEKMDNDGNINLKQVV